MRIDANGKIDNIHPGGADRLPQSQEEGAGLEDALKPDRVELSQSAQGKDELTLMKEKIIDELDRGTPPDKLRRLKAEIENGTYQVSASDIAESILGK